jgi:hypothetical protein
MRQTSRYDWYEALETAKSLLSDRMSGARAIPTRRGASLEEAAEQGPPEILEIEQSSINELRAGQVWLEQDAIGINYLDVTHRGRPGNGCCTKWHERVRWA